MIRYWMTLSVAVALCFSSSNSFATEAGRLKLNGYKDARWGMSPVQVKQALKLEVREQRVKQNWRYETSDDLEFHLDGTLYLECLFFHGKLYFVKLPFYFNNQKTLDVKAALVKKYGKPATSGSDKFYEKIIWDDGVSRITLNGQANGYASNVVYENLALSQSAKKEEKLNEEKEQKQRERENRESLNKQL